MEPRRLIEDFTNDLLRLQHLLQDGPQLTEGEELIIKTALESLLQDLDDNRRKLPVQH